MTIRLICFACAVMVATACAQSSEPKNGRTIRVVAHRGVHHSAAENSPSAIRGAIELGCDYVEVDVRRTRDGALVLMHDSSVDRTTTGRGKVQAMTLAEIRRLRFRTKSDSPSLSEKVPTFDEALELCRDKIMVYVDNKSGPAKDVVDAIRKHQMIEQVVVYGSVDELRKIRKHDRRVPIQPPHPGSREKIEALSQDLKPETLDGHLKSWTAEQVAAAHRVGAEVCVDVMGLTDNEAGYRRAIEMGVDAIQTDHPGDLIRLLKTTFRR